MTRNPITRCLSILAAVLVVGGAAGAAERDGPVVWRELDAVDADRRLDLKAQDGVRGLPTVWFITSEGAGITYIPGYVDAPTFRQVLEWVWSGADAEQSFDEFTGAGG